MTREETARTVLAAVDGGKLPRGGPSEAAARGLLGQLPSGYWSQWSDAAADRIQTTRECLTGETSGVTPLKDGAAA